MIRYLHSTSCRNGRIKQSLDTFTKMNMVKHPVSKRDLKYKEEKAKRYEVSKSFKPLSKATAKAVIEKKLDVKLDDLSPETKFTEEQLKELFKNPNKRLIYSFLGISGEQLKDADIVNKDVNKFLARDEVSKAIYVCKLAQKKGVVAMNFVMTYLLERERLDEALSLYQYRKKWGIQPNEYTYSILFEGLSKQKRPVSEKLCESIFKILEKLREKEELSVIHLSTALKALFNSTKPEKAVEFFDSLSKKDGLDNKIFSLYLFSLSEMANNDTFVVQHADACFSRALKILEWREIDSQLINAYALCYLKRGNLQYVSRSINIIRSWFKICEEDKILQKIRFTEPPGYRSSHLITSLIELLDLNPFGKRLPLNTFVLDVYITALHTLGLFRKSVQSFDDYSAKVDVDVTLFNDYLKSITKLEPVLEDMTGFNENKLIKNLLKMKALQIKPNFETNIIIHKFFNKKINKFVSLELDDQLKKTNANYFVSFLNQLEKLIIDLQSHELSIRQNIDFLHLFTQLRNQLSLSEQMNCLHSNFFEKHSSFSILNKTSDRRHVKQVKTLEIITLTMLKDLISILQNDLHRKEITWSSVNRLRNTIQAHVHYIQNLDHIEDPGYSKLAAIEEDIALNIKNLKLFKIV